MSDTPAPTGRHTATLIIASDGDGKVEVTLEFDCPPDPHSPALVHQLGAHALHAIACRDGRMPDLHAIRKH